MRIPGKVIVVSAAFTAGAGLGVLACVAVLSKLIEHNKDLFNNFVSDMVNKFVYGDRRSSIRRYAGPPMRSPRVSYHNPFDKVE